MTSVRAGLALFMLALSAGTWLDARRPGHVPDESILVADLHVHGFPGDGALTVAQLAREAESRGIDVLALTGHNNRASLALARWVPTTPRVLVIPGQEITAPDFHLIAVGVDAVVDWRLDAPAAISEVHRLGGAAIAAHPVETSWKPRDPETLALLDGVEVAHPSREHSPDVAAELDGFFASVRAVKPGVGAIGSSDFHMAAPLGRCRTYVFAEERSRGGVVRALRAGRTVAEDGEGRLSGPAELVERVTPELRRRGATPGLPERGCALAALIGLGMLSFGRGRARQ